MGQAKAERDRQTRGNLVPLVFSHLLPNALADLQGLVWWRIVQDQQELFATNAGDEVRVTRFFAQDLRELYEHAIAYGMAEPVVDALEIVSVQHRYRQGSAACLGIGQYLRERLVHTTSVCQTSEFVTQRVQLKSLRAVDSDLRFCACLLGLAARGFCLEARHEQFGLSPQLPPRALALQPQIGL